LQKFNEAANDCCTTPFLHLTQLYKVGQGGFGAVFKAEHKLWGTVAYKRLQANGFDVEEWLVQDIEQNTYDVNMIKCTAVSMNQNAFI